VPGYFFITLAAVTGSASRPPNASGKNSLKKPAFVKPSGQAGKPAVIFLLFYIFVDFRTYFTSGFLKVLVHFKCGRFK
jgi:hypothetical protein